MRRQLHVLSFFVTTALWLSTQINGVAQTAIHDGTGTAPNNSAMLDVQGNNTGILIPRVSLNSTASFAPVVGTAVESLLIYNTNGTIGKGYYYWDGAKWVRVLSGNTPPLLTEIDPTFTGTANTTGAISRTGAISVSNRLTLNSTNFDEHLLIQRTGAPDGHFSTSTGDWVQIWPGGATDYGSKGIRLNNSGSVQLMNYTANGLLKTTGGNGTLAVATGADLPSGSDNYIQNMAVNNNFSSGQTASFDITGNGEIGGTLEVGGNVGIGTTAPQGVLEVVGDIWASLTANNDNAIRIRPGLTSGNQYGFADQHNNVMAFVNEQGTTNQAIVLGDVSTNNGSTLFGVSIATTAANPTTGAEAGWEKRFEVAGNGTIKLNTYTTNGIVRTTGGNGTLSSTGGGISLTTEVTGVLPVANGGSGTSTAFTPGSVIFAGAGGVYAQNNPRFFWNNSNLRLGIGTASPNGKIHVVGTSSGDGGWDDDGILVQNTGSAGEAAVSFNNSVTGTDYWQTGLNQSEHYDISYGSSFTNGNTKLRIENTGNIGIGTVSPTYKLHVIGRLKTTGINETSDARLKTNIAPISDALSNVLKMKGVTYNWKHNEFPEMGLNDDLQHGLIAQELEKIVPELVLTDKEGWKSIEYTHLVPMLIEAIKDLNALVGKQEKENHGLKASLRTMDERLRTLENISAPNTSLNK